VAVESEGHFGRALASFQRLTTTLLGSVRTRVELVSCEFEDEWRRIAVILLMGAFAFFCAVMSLSLAVGFIIAVFWETYRLQAIGAIACTFLIIALATAWRMGLRLRTKQPMFSETLNQLSRDIEALSNRRGEESR
jgi:uncharacterized membrane protein YqjE